MNRHQREGWRAFARTALFVPLFAASTACGTVAEAVAEATPYGVQLRERVAQWDRWCRNEKLGPYNASPRTKHITTCDFLYLKDQRWDPNADEFSRYAHSIKLPPPHDQPQAQYRPGMTSRQYFEELCAKEAGEWIFRTVTGVKGVLQARPYVPTSPLVSSLIPNTQEPDVSGGNFDYFWAQVSDERGSFERDKFSGYTFLEIPSHGTTGFRTYYRSIGDLERSQSGRQPEWNQYRNLYNVPFVVN